MSWLNINIHTIAELAHEFHVRASQTKLDSKRLQAIMTSGFPSQKLWEYAALTALISKEQPRSPSTFIRAAELFIAAHEAIMSDDLIGPIPAETICDLVAQNELDEWKLEDILDALENDPNAPLMARTFRNSYELTLS